VNPKPLDENNDFIHKTLHDGFKTFQNFYGLENSIKTLLNKNLNFFSSMKTKKQLGEFIEISNKEKTYEKKAETFLKLLNE
jgi:hypothetical protein